MGGLRVLGALGLQDHGVFLFDNVWDSSENSCIWDLLKGSL